MADEDDRADEMADEEDRADEEERATTDAGSAAQTDSIPDQVREFVGTGVFWATLLILVFVAAIVAVVVQNTHDVAFEFLWFDTTTPLLTVILFTALISVVCVEAVTAIWRLRRRQMLSQREELRRLRGTAPGRRWWRWR